jgi:uncharacterized protein YcbK (DUF882 family)
LAPEADFTKPVPNFHALVWDWRRKKFTDIDALIPQKLDMISQRATCFLRDIKSE